MEKEAALKQITSTDDIIICFERCNKICNEDRRSMNLEPVNLIALKFEREANDDIKSAFFHIPDVTCIYNLENGNTILKTTFLSN